MEGKPFKPFLHLEDLRKQGTGIDRLLDSNGQEIMDTNGILGLLHSFYKDLYSILELSPTTDQIQQFLGCVPSLLRIRSDTSALILPITEQEVLSTIKCL